MNVETPEPSSASPVLTRIAAGDREATAECLDRFGALVWHLALRFCSNRADAEDAVQEIFVEIWKSADRFRAEKSSERTFIAMIARRRLIDRQRRSRREPQVGTLVEAPSREPSNATRAELAEEADRAQRVLSKLGSEQQEVIRRSVYAGASHAQIAADLDLPLGTVKAHIRRGLQKVREALSGESGLAASTEVRS